MKNELEFGFVEYDENKILYGDSIIPDEVDEDIESQESYIKEAQINFCISVVINDFGKFGFMHSYNNFINHILSNASFQSKKLMCFEFLKRIEDVYNFEFFNNFDFLDEEEIIEFLRFIKFLEFDNETFIRNIWASLNSKLVKRYSIEFFCNNNREEIINNLRNLDKLNKFKNDFFMNYEEVDLMRWFIKNSKKIKQQIIIDNLERN